MVLGYLREMRAGTIGRPQAAAPSHKRTKHRM
jgi:hypothetical protein